MRRPLDVAIAAVALIVCAPALLVVIVLVRLSGRGPVIFRQERIGRDGQPFEIMKFRTMRAGAAGLSITTQHDHRITRVGRWLRATKIDEIPQLVNVLIGDMSLVGPRPELARYVDLWPETARSEILRVRPGITDPASIAFRNESAILSAADDPERCYVEEILPRKVELYRRYVAERSTSGDLRILGRTAVAVVKG